MISTELAGWSVFGLGALLFVTGCVTVGSWLLMQRGSVAARLAEFRDGRWLAAPETGARSVVSPGLETVVESSRVATGGEASPLFSGDRVVIRRGPYRRRQYSMALTPRQAVAIPAVAWGLVLMVVSGPARTGELTGFGDRPREEVSATVLAVDMAFVALLPVGVGMAAGVVWFVVTARRVPGVVVGVRDHPRSERTWQVLIEYEHGGRVRRAWSPTAYGMQPGQGREVHVFVDRHNPGHVYTVGASTILVPALFTVVGLGPILLFGRLFF